MEFKVLAIGDVVCEAGLKMVRTRLPQLRRQLNVDFTIVNGENAGVVGLTPDMARDIYSSGADVITLGNHTFGRREICDYLDDHRDILRPANYAPQVPGQGWGVYDSKVGDIAVINLIGRCNMDYTPDNPFLMIDKILEKIKTKFIFIDFHAEATSEKLAMGYLLDGKVSAVWGTHTHVPTADDQVLPKGTGYVTDLGMTGPRYSVLGIKPELSISRFLGNVPIRYQPAPGKAKMEGVLFTIDSATGRCTGTERVTVYD